jgi:hypothetical protein
MTAQASRGNTSEAARTYRACQRALCEQLGVDPCAKTDAAYRSLLPPGGPAAAPPPAWPLTAILAEQPESPFAGRRADRQRLDRLWRISRTRQAMAVGSCGGNAETYGERPGRECRPGMR